MSEIVLVSPHSDFEDDVRAAYDGEFKGTRVWDPSWSRISPEKAVDLIGAPECSVVVLGPGFGTAEAIDLAAAFDTSRPDVCTVVVAKPSAKSYELALRAGARDLIDPETPGSALRTTLARASEAAERRRTLSILQDSKRQPGRIITIVGSKGGSGKTTTATNLAVGLAKGAPGRVVIVDLDLQFGDVASALSLSPQVTIADAARSVGKMSATALKMFLQAHPEGAYVLCAPALPAEADDVPAAFIGHVLDLLAGEFDYVVVDTAAGLDEAALAAADRSTDLVLVCATDVPSVRSMRKAIDALDLLDMTQAQRHLVLNRSDARVGLAKRDIEATIGLPVDVSVPSSRTVPISINQGSPVILSDPRSPVARALTQLVYRFLVASPRVEDGAQIRRMEMRRAS